MQLLLCLSCFLACINLSISQSPLFCEYTHKTHYKLDTDFECNKLNLEANSKTVTKGSFMIYKRNVNEYKIQAFHCMRTRHSFYTYTSAVYGPPLEKHNKTQLSVSVEECRRFYNHKISEDGKLINNGNFYSTLNKPTPKYSGRLWNCCYWADSHTDNSFLQNLQIVKSPDNKLYSSIGDLSSCNPESQGCQLEDGSAIIWKFDNPETNCKYIQYKRMNGSLVHNTFISDENSFGLTITKGEISDCNNILIPTQQGFAIASTEYRSQINSNNRKKREINDVGIVTSNQLASDLQYVEFSENEKLRKIFDHFDFHSCKRQKEMHSLLYNALSINPTKFARNLFKRHEIIAFLNQNILTIIPCHKIDNYKFIPMSNKKCTAFLPLKFIAAGKSFSGYLDTTTMAVTKSSPPQSCEAIRDIPIRINSKFYTYEPNTGVLSSIDDSKISKIPIYDTAVGDSFESLIPFHIFKNQVIQNFSTIDTHLTPVHIWDEVEHQTSKYNNLIKGNEDSIDLLNNSIFYFGYFHFKDMWIFACCIYVTFLFTKHISIFLLRKALIRLGFIPQEEHNYTRNIFRFPLNNRKECINSPTIACINTIPQINHNKPEFEVWPSPIQCSSQSEISYPHI